MKSASSPPPLHHPGTWHLPASILTIRSACSPDSAGSISSSNAAAIFATTAIARLHSKLQSGLCTAGAASIRSELWSVSRCQRCHYTDGSGCDGQCRGDQSRICRTKSPEIHQHAVSQTLLQRINVLCSAQAATLALSMET